MHATETRAGERPPQTAAPTSRWPGRAALPIAFVAIAVVFGLLFYGEARYRSCIQRVEAAYPAVPVSAYNQRETGSLKVSFVEERARALSDCGRI